MNLIFANGRSDAVTHLESLGESVSDWIIFHEDSGPTKGRHLERLRDRVIFLANPERNEWAAEMTLVIATIGGPVVHTDGKIYEGGVHVGTIDPNFNVPETRRTIRELGFSWVSKALVFGIEIEDCECGHTFEEHGDSIDPSCQIDGCNECEVWSP